MINDPSYLKNSKRKIIKKEDLPLSLYSSNDKIWNGKKEATSLLAKYLKNFSEFKKWGERISECAEFLNFKFEIDKESGEMKLILSGADFCRCRHCLVCNWRRSLRLKASFYSFIEPFIKENPKARFVFLTLTVPNVRIEKLSEKLKEMNIAWQRLRQRKATRIIEGFIRSTEVTREKKRRNYAHPHFHVLLHVSEKYFQGANYLSRAKWLKLWQEAMRDDSITQVDVRAVKKDIRSDHIVSEITKTMSYSIKIDEFENLDNWMLEYFRQVHRKRFIVSGGTLKDSIKDLRNSEENNDDLIHVDDEDKSKISLKEGEELFFNWRDFEKIYRKFNSE